MKLRVVQVAVILFLASALNSSLRALTSDTWTVRTEPSELVNGSPVLFRVVAPAMLASLRGTWSARELSFRFSADCNCWYAIAGIDLNLPAGKYPLRLEG